MNVAVDSQHDRPLVLVVGGGVAALEACLVLRTYVTAEEVDIELMAPVETFEYRPLAVLEPFEGGVPWTLPLACFADDQDLAHVRDALVGVDAPARTVRTAAGEERHYDLLLVAAGAGATEAFPGALTFGGSADAPALRDLLAAATRGDVRRVAFAVPGTPYWSLPLYELALLFSAHVAQHGAPVELVLVTPEPSPLGLFGPRASRAVAAMLAGHGVRLETGAQPVSAGDGELVLADGRRLAADAVVTMPRLAGRAIAGLPADAEGFVPIDAHGRVPGRERVFAAGDVTSFPFKQGGLAAQQADAAAEAILGELGLPIVPRPFHPVLQGVLYTDHHPAYLQSPLDAESDAQATAPRAFSLWWPPSKIAGVYLSPYLTIRAGAPRAPEVRPETDILPVLVDVDNAVEG